MSMRGSLRLDPKMGRSKVLLPPGSELVKKARRGLSSTMSASSTDGTEFDRSQPTPWPI